MVIVRKLQVQIADFYKQILIQRDFDTNIYKYKIFVLRTWRWPGVYTRVFAYVKLIEDIIWPEI